MALGEALATKTAFYNIICYACVSTVGVKQCTANHQVEKGYIGYIGGPINWYIKTTIDITQV